MFLFLTNFPSDLAYSVRRTGGAGGWGGFFVNVLSFLLLLSISQTVVIMSFDPANRYGKRGQSYLGGACGERRTGTWSHLRHQCPPGTDVERAVHNRVHTGIGAGEQEQRVSYLRVNQLRRIFVYPIPEKRNNRRRCQKEKYKKVRKSARCCV